MAQISVVLLWQETGLLGEKPLVQPGNHKSAYVSSVGGQTQAAMMIGQSVNFCAM